MQSKENTLFNGCRLYQIPHISATQAMGYILEDNSQSLVVIDGGTAAESVFLERLILSRNNKVKAWFLTHAHLDHIGALIDILKRKNIEIERLYYTFPSKEWLNAAVKEREIELPVLDAFFEAVIKSNVRTAVVRKNQSINIGEFTIHCLNDTLKNLHLYNINETSLVVRVKTPNESILFLGDASLATEKDLINDWGESLQTNIVQMSHHGQGGVSEEFYKIVSPKICLWPTPIWLWDNNRGNNGKNTGPWSTLNTRRWIRKIKAKNYVSKNKLIILK